MLSYANFDRPADAINDLLSLSETIDFRNTAVAFHGYAGEKATAATLDAVINAGFPCMCTEFTEQKEIDLFEEHAVSWLSLLSLDELRALSKI
ncbi:MAG: hypothetical protein JXA18_01295 [Chitinispirillaceae bacterium]|nr:hypothetical protein [Chitinispirillaceae bacterium]